MRIGLDIDNVISNFDKKLMEELIKEDKNKRNTGIIMLIIYMKCLTGVLKK